jgi:hypothetical protein
LDEFVVIEDSESQKRSTAARLFFTGVQLVECAHQFFKVLSRLAELAFRHRCSFRQPFGSSGKGRSMTSSIAILIGQIARACDREYPLE